MKIAVASQGQGLDALVDSRFGRCAYLVLVDTDTGAVESVPNPSLSAAHGAGVSTAQFLLERGVEVICARNIGPKALSALEASGIRVSSVEGDTVGDAVRNLQQGQSEKHE